MSSKGGSSLSSETTCASIVSFAQRLEEASSEFYERSAEKHPKARTSFLAFAKESKKNKLLITRTYQETISDALEACFIQMNLSDYQLEATLRKGTSFAEALKTALDLEEKASEFYTEAAEQSKSLLATIPRAFRTVAKKRRNRKPALKSLLKGLT